MAIRVQINSPPTPLAWENERAISLSHTDHLRPFLARLGAVGDEVPPNMHRLFVVLPLTAGEGLSESSMHVVFAVQSPNSPVAHELGYEMTAQLREHYVFVRYLAANEYVGFSGAT